MRATGIVTPRRVCRRCASAPRHRSCLRLWPTLLPGHANGHGSWGPGTGRGTCARRRPTIPSRRVHPDRPRTGGRGRMAGAAAFPTRKKQAAGYPYPFRAGGREMLAMGQASGKTIAEMKMVRTIRPAPSGVDVQARLDAVWEAMDDCITRPVALRMEWRVAAALRVQAAWRGPIHQQAFWGPSGDRTWPSHITGERLGFPVYAMADERGERGRGAACHLAHQWARRAVAGVPLGPALLPRPLHRRETEARAAARS